MLKFRTPFLERLIIFSFILEADSENHRLLSLNGKNTNQDNVLVQCMY